MSSESMKELRSLAKLVKTRNDAARKISKKIGTPALIGNVGEYIAERVFGIKLETSRTKMGIDGKFKWGALQGLTVNVKMYTIPKVLDINHDAPADLYLVLAGPSDQSGKILPWCIHNAFLFDYKELMKDFKTHERKIKREMSLRKELWTQAEIYPEKRNRRTVLSANQRKMLSLFNDCDD